MSDKPVDHMIILHRQGYRQVQFLNERYWERPMWGRHYSFSRGCEDRNGVRRPKHVLDKDSRCVFCDYLKPM